jgi:nucleoside-diphosphate-sugar epimerase
MTASMGRIVVSGAMRILVTGLAGFIGSSLGPALRARGHDVQSKDMRGCHAVVHLANIAHAKAGRPELWKVNVEGTTRAATLAAREGVRRFVYISSAKASAPDDVYGEAKLAAENALANLASDTRLEVVIIRPPLVYGPRVRANFLALMRAIAHGWPLPLASIENRRSLVYVGNLCDAIAACVESPAAAGKSFYVADGDAMSTPQLCRAIGRALGRPARLFRFPPALLPIGRLTGSLEVDDSALRQELAWRPPFTVEEGLRATAEWYRQQA